MHWCDALLCPHFKLSRTYGHIIIWSMIMCKTWVYFFRIFAFVYYPTSITQCINFCSHIFYRQNQKFLFITVAWFNHTFYFMFFLREKYNAPKKVGLGGIIPHLNHIEQKELFSKWIIMCNVYHITLMVQAPFSFI